MIEKIIKQNIKLFGENAVATKIEIGFTNEVYSVADKYIVKIYCDKDKYEQEKLFFETYIGEYVPRIYLAKEYGDKQFYSIIEKIEGVNLYSKWHTLCVDERRHIIAQLCDFIRLTNKKQTEINWLQHNLNEVKLAKKLLPKDVFTEFENDLICKATERFNLFLKEKESASLIHSDLHFDNIFYDIKTRKIKIIDYDRAIIAPKDFDFDIIDRMIRKPHLFANEQDENYVELKHYIDIYSYIDDCKLEVIKIDFFNKRLAIYNMIYNLYNLKDYPHLQWLKDEVITSAKIIIE